MKNRTIIRRYSEVANMVKDHRNLDKSGRRLLSLRTDSLLTAAAVTRKSLHANPADVASAFTSAYREVCGDAPRITPERFHDAILESLAA